MSDVTAVMDLHGEEPQLALPPGFRFHPTDEEVVTHYLTPKIHNPNFSYESYLVVANVDLNNTEPWNLPKEAKVGEKEWFFFVQKSRKYPTGTRTNRATKSGYWKATGKDKEIFRGTGREAVLVGMKKTLVFYRGRAPNGRKTSWVMHEYRLEGTPSGSPKDDWAVCRLFNKDLAANNGPQMAPAADGGMEEEDPFAFLDDFLSSDDLLNNADLLDNVDLPDNADLLDNADLPMLMDSPLGAVDFVGASSSTSSAALPLEPDMEHLTGKTEPPATQQKSPNYMWKM